MYNTNDSSRWGIKAEEDIGGGVKAGVTIESWIGSLPRKNFGYEAATMGGAGAATNTYQLYGVGNSIDATKLGDRILAAHITFGQHTIQAGQNSAFVRDIAVAYQADASNSVGNIIANDGTMTIRNVAANYLYNAGNLTAGLGITNNIREQDGASSAKTATGYQLKARYATGPMSVAGAYSVAKTDTNTSATATISTSAQLQSPAISGLGANTKSLETKTTILAADYDLTVAKLYAEYGQVKVSSDQGITADTNDRHAISVGARVPFGKAWAFAQISDGKQKNGTAQYDGDWNGYTVGARYEFSKRTYAYIVNGHTEYKFNTAGDKVKANQYGLGLVHNF
jgi:predicted porin